MEQRQGLHFKGAVAQIVGKPRKGVLPPREPFETRAAQDDAAGGGF